MMTVSGTVLLTYFATEIAKMSKEDEDYMFSLHFLHKCMVELKALMQVNDSKRKTKTTRDMTPNVSLGPTGLLILRLHPYQFTYY
jgi:hypothetical protein